MNLYAYVDNDVINNFDPLGYKRFSKGFGEMLEEIFGPNPISDFLIPDKYAPYLACAQGAVAGAGVGLGACGGAPVCVPVGAACGCGLGLVADKTWDQIYSELEREGKKFVQWIDRKSRPISNRFQQWIEREFFGWWPD